MIFLIFSYGVALALLVAVIYLGVAFALPVAAIYLGSPSNDLRTFASFFNAALSVW